MTRPKVLITGAAGFIGTRLCERFQLKHDVPYRALVRGFSRANFLARLNAEMVAGDLISPEAIRNALEGCSAVVHLAYSDEKVAPTETKNLLAACRQANVKLIHISSMAVHGPYPSPECAREETAVIGRYGEAYCDSKAEVEQLVAQSIRRDGLKAVILRPTMIYGPHSPHVLRVMDEARRGHISLVDGGKWYCNAVYIDDVCDAIFAALNVEEAVGKAFFITGDRAITWKDFILEFAQMVEPPPVTHDYSAEQIRQHWLAQRPTLASNFRALIKLAASPQFHRQLAAVPALGAAIYWTKRTLAQNLSPEQVRKLKKRTAPAPSQTAPVTEFWPDKYRLMRETFPLEFSNELARRVLGWRPAYDLTRGAQLTKEWLKFARMLKAYEMPAPSK